MQASSRSYPRTKPRSSATKLPRNMRGRDLPRLVGDSVSDSDFKMAPTGLSLIRTCHRHRQRTLRERTQVKDVQRTPIQMFAGPRCPALRTEPAVRLFCCSGSAAASLGWRMRHHQPKSFALPPPRSRRRPKGAPAHPNVGVASLTNLLRWPGRGPIGSGFCGLQITSVIGKVWILNLRRKRF